MMNNMFSMFDPSSSTFSMTWMILLLIPLMVFLKYKNKTNTKMNKIMLKTSNLMVKELKQLMLTNKKWYSTLMMVSMMMLIMVLNSQALLPFNFTPTSHLSISLSLALTLWLSTIMWGWIKSFHSMMTHLTPLGTPSALMSFMVIIEMISNLIRPITLSVRLSANMVAGHLLISLLSNFSMMSSTNSIMSCTFMFMLTLLEMMVSLIQGYVFILLLVLYHNESLS